MTLSLAVLAPEPGIGLGAFAARLDAAEVDYELIDAGDSRVGRPIRFDGVIALGGSLGVDDARLAPTRRFIASAVRAGMPYLGVGLGGRLLASVLGAVVRPGRPVTGLHDVFLTNAAERDPLFAGLPGRFEVLGWNEDSFRLPRGAVPLAGSLRCACEAFRYGAAAYGLRFHPEARVDDLVRWRRFNGYRVLAERAGVDFDGLALAVGRATPALDVLAEHLLERWLSVASGAPALTTPIAAAR